MLAHEQPENEPEKEPSAFRQVHAEYTAYQPVSKATWFPNFVITYFLANIFLTNMSIQQIMVSFPN